MSSNSQPKSSLLVAHIKTFLEAYHNERKTSKKKSSNCNSSSSFDPFRDSSYSGLSQRDPTTANAFNTNTVVILRKKPSSLKNSPFDGVRLSNYRLRPQDVQREVFDWVSHFLWLK